MKANMDKILPVVASVGVGIATLSNVEWKWRENEKYGPACH
ncbi:hypothetical protein [Peribacillus sp. FSL E2-0159]